MDARTGSSVCGSEHVYSVSLELLSGRSPCLNLPTPRLPWSGNVITCALPPRATSRWSPHQSRPPNQPQRKIAIRLTRASVQHCQIPLQIAYSRRWNRCHRVASTSEKCTAGCRCNPSNLPFDPQIGHFFPARRHRPSRQPFWPGAGGMAAGAKANQSRAGRIWQRVAGGGGVARAQVCAHPPPI